jgi:hypothetical protein
VKNKFKKNSSEEFYRVKNVDGDLENLLNYFIDTHPNAQKEEFLYFLNQYLLTQGKLKTSHAYYNFICTGAKQSNKFKHSFKELIKKMHRDYTKLRLKFMLRDTKICLVGPAKQCNNSTSDCNLMILLKLFHPEHLLCYHDKKVLLIWNGSACDRYLSNPISLSDNVICILAKTTMANVRAIRLANPGKKVFQYKTLNQAKWGDQTIIVDAIQLFHGVGRIKIRLTGFDLRVSDYQDDYKKIYQAHSQKDDLLKQFYNGHAPYTDFLILSDFYRKGYYTPDEKLKDILSLDLDQYLERLENVVN